MTRPGAAALLAHAATRAGAPTTVVFQVTDRCNYDCVHCYETHGDADELSFAEIDRILGELADEGVLFLTLTGGEVYMRRDADEILRAARRRGFAVKVLTTGHFIDERRADLIAGLGAVDVGLSLYSSDAHVHETVTRVRGSWQRTLDAATRLRARGVAVNLRTPVMRLNVGTLGDLRRLAEALGCDVTFDPKVTAREDGGRAPLGLRTDDEVLRAYYGDADGLWTHLARAFATAPADPQRGRGLDETPCTAGVQSLGIDPQGIVSACHTLKRPAGDLRARSFREIWRGSAELAMVRGLTWGALAECRTCDVRPYCQRCHGMAHVEDGDVAGPSIEACRHALILRDLLRDRGLVPASETALPPPLARASASGRPLQIRPPALRVVS